MFGTRPRRESDYSRSLIDQKYVATQRRQTLVKVVGRTTATCDVLIDHDYALVLTACWGDSDSHQA